MFHSAVTVGLNTSALIEAGIVGRAVHTILLPEFYENQEGTLHFHYLLDGGLLRSARDLDAHLAQLAESLATADPAVHHNRAFVERFVRPHGLESAATPAFTDAVERVAQLGVARSAEPPWVPVLRRVMTPLARRTAGTFAEQISRKRRRRDKERAKVERVTALEAQRVAEKQQLAEQRQGRREAVVREREADKARVQAERTAARQQEVARKQQEKEARMTQWRRDKQRAAFRSIVASSFRRVIGAFTSNR
jgi:hypothetical protein